jgi:hypothetical protein
MPDMRGAHWDLVVGLRMAEIDHLVDRQKPSVERSWARSFWPHTHTLALKRLATDGTERLRFRFDEQELASGAGLRRVRDAIVAFKATSTSGAAHAAQSAAPLRALRLYSRREIFPRTAWLRRTAIWRRIGSTATALHVHRFRVPWRRAEVLPQPPTGRSASSFEETHGRSA